MPPEKGAACAQPKYRVGFLPYLGHEVKAL